MTVTGQFELAEVVANGIVNVLTENLPSIIAELNAGYNDGVTLEVPAAGHILPYITTEAALGAGTPLIGVAEMPATFEDDLISSVVAQHRFYIYVVEAHSDLATLVKLLRRYTRAVALAIQKDRNRPLEGKEPTMGRGNLAVWSVMLEATAPGPLLGDRDPSSPPGTPTSWLSWAGLVIKLKREEL